MIGAFVLLFAGGVLLGGAYSFHKSEKPTWSVVVMAIVGVVCLGVALWAIQQY